MDKSQSNKRNIEITTRLFGGIPKGFRTKAVLDKGGDALFVHNGQYVEVSQKFFKRYTVIKGKIVYI